MIAGERLFDIRRDGEVVIATPTSDLRELEYERISREAEDVLALLGEAGGGARSVVLDLRRTDVYGSTALGFFATLWKRVRDRGGRMALCNVSDHELRILQATKLDTVWPICPTLDEALRTVRSEPTAQHP
ncbi:MAG TPA: STAS domain-containing protein [Planctomycetaceae bacterium]